MQLMNQSGFLKKYLDRIDHPIRNQVLSKDELCSRAKILSSDQTDVSIKEKSYKIRQRLKENFKILKQVYWKLNELQANKIPLTAGAEWLLDNYHIIEEQIKEIRRDLPRGYYKSLPRFTLGPNKGYPRVYSLIIDYIANTDATINDETLLSYFKIYQEKTPLLIGEVWAIPIMLRLALVENLRRLSLQSLKLIESKQQLESFIDQLLDRVKISKGDLLLEIAPQIKKNDFLLKQGATLLIKKVSSLGSKGSILLQWIYEQISSQNLDINQLMREEFTLQAQTQISFGNSILSLKNISIINWREWFEKASVVDEVLSEESSKIYYKSDFSTHDLYREEIEKISRNSNFTELEIAKEAVNLANQNFSSSKTDEQNARSHVGYYLIGQGRKELLGKIGYRYSPLESASILFNKVPTLFYLLPIFTITIVSAKWILKLFPELQNANAILYYFTALLITLITSEFVILFTQQIYALIIKPKPLPKLDLDQGIPSELATNVVIQTIFNDLDSVEKLIEAIEIRYLSNPHKNLYFGILADLPDSSTPNKIGDQGLINFASQRIKDLNFKHGQELFFIMFRERTYNSADNNYMGWERKRGKIHEFNQFVLGKETGFNFIVGDISKIKQAKYVITLDNDTKLPPKSAKKLIGAIAHPLNQAVVNPNTKIVSSGYAIMQPRMSTNSESSYSSIFSYIFAGESGLDPYTRTVSDTYQDLFHHGSYVGKGIYNIEAFEASLENRFADNHLLSHDLIESCFAKCAIASDIELFDDFPSKYNSQSKRLHRWIRGDWQIIDWLLPIVRGKKGTYKNPISLISKWKIIDNLRRSLIPIAQFILILIGYSLITERGHFLWTTSILLLSSFSVLGVICSIFANLPIGFSASRWYSSLIIELYRVLRLIALNFCFIPHQSYLNCHAIIVTLYRKFYSKKNLLEWETAYSAEKRLGNSIKEYYLLFKPTFIGIFGFLILNLMIGNQSYSLALVLLAWILAPFFAWYISQPEKISEYETTTEDLSYLLKIAKDTWSYFNSFLKEEYNYLIPDNLQIVPDRIVAERTSPTNISLSMLSIISAYDLGFITITETLNKNTKIVETIKRLEKFKGHLLNWYEIKTLNPLPPKYISSVDSGNFIGHLVVLHEFYKKYQFHALLNELSLKNEKDLDQSNFSAKSINSLYDLALKDNDYADLLKYLDWVEHIPQIERLAKESKLPKRLTDINNILSHRVPSLNLIYKLTNRLLKLEKLTKEEQISELNPLFEKLKNTRAVIIEEINNSNKLAKEVESIINETELGFLYEQRNKLLTIGFNLDKGQKDNSYYDLLASEARLASLIGIAKGDLPLEHWFTLGRTMTKASGGSALLSWSGTMFEYLMPILVMKNVKNSLLDRTYKAVVKTQKSYAKSHKIPWGISESAYSGVDFHNTYQYKAFGIPGLGLKRGLTQDFVISPYSTALALPIDPKSSISNFRRLEKIGARGEYGFYEAIDFTPDRLNVGEKFHLIRSFLAHHQGMSLAAINNLINNGILQSRFHSSPIIKAVDVLLEEKYPNRIPLLYPHQPEIRSSNIDKNVEQYNPTEIVSSPHTVYPINRLISNGKLSEVIDSCGSGYLTLNNGIRLTRHKESKVLNNYGSYIYIKDTKLNKTWSATYQPTLVEPDEYEAIFNHDKVEFRRKNFQISTLLESTISADENVQIKRLTVNNHDSEPRTLEFASYGEVTLASAKADMAHPAFSNLFVETEYLEEFDAILFSRRKRSSSETQHYLFHLFTAGVVFAPISADSSKFSFIGRGRNRENPIGLSKSSTGKFGTVLDPIFSLKNLVELNPNSSQEMYFITGYCNSRNEAINLIKKYKEISYINRSFELAWSHADIELRNLNFSPSTLNVVNSILLGLSNNIAEYRAPAEILKKANSPINTLWRLGISGDEPIVLLKLNDENPKNYLEELITAQEYLRIRGIIFDLVVLTESHGGYQQTFEDEIDFTIKTSPARDRLDRTGGVFVRSILNLSDQEIVLLNSIARIVISSGKETLKNILKIDNKIRHQRINLPAFTPIERVRKVKPSLVSGRYTNGLGSFSEDGSQYTIHTSPDNLPPRPWSNVVANKNFGFLITETGAGYTWSDNSREYRLTTWSNDPVSDPHSELIYIRECETNNFWNPTAGPVKDNNEVIVNHTQGYSSFSTVNQSIQSELSVSIDPHKNLKVYTLNLTNNDSKSKDLEVYFYIDPVLGVTKLETYRNLISNFDADQKIISFRNPLSIEFSHKISFIGSNYEISSFTTSKEEFIGANGSLSFPLAFKNALLNKGFLSDINKVKNSIQLSNKIGTGYDQAGILQVKVSLKAGSSESVSFFLGCENNLDDINNQLSSTKSDNYLQNISKVSSDYWDGFLNKIEVNTPNTRFNILVNNWLLYQSYCCRMLARTGFYQSSGALGFRDQLQDSLSMLLVQPEITREQILLNCSRQFIEGDVQHWWHPPSGRGIRARITDNYIWLPYAVSQYIKITGDYSILNEKVNFLTGPKPDSTQHDLYFTPNVSNEQGTVLEHCLRSLRRATGKDGTAALGPNGIPLIGTGDWNDGMNLVGEHGQGESIWLGWFIISTIKEFCAVVTDGISQDERIYFLKFANAVGDSIEDKGWDGNWYKRAFYDDGTPIGSSKSQECMIDNIAQSWSVISGAGKNQDIAIQSAYENLFDKKSQILKLLTPPFKNSDPNPGYIQGYPAGLRENGGQYTHGSIWLILAFALKEKGDIAHELFSAINPISHTDSPSKVAQYQTEPYVLCGDVYSEGSLAGTGGWSWYTGSSGWFYRIATEYLIGLRVNFGSEFEFKPIVPSNWNNFSVKAEIFNYKLNITYINPNGSQSGVNYIMLDGKKILSNKLAFSLLNSENINNIEIYM